MAYAYRLHSTTVELDASQTSTYRLPPMTPGLIVIDAKNVHLEGGGPEGPSEPGVPGTGQPIGGTPIAREVPGRRIPRGLGVGGTRIDIGTVGSTTTSDPRPPADAGSPADVSAPGTAVARDIGVGRGPRFRGSDLGDLIGDIGIGGGGEASGITLELLLGDQVQASDPNHVAHRTANSGDVWSLRVTRAADGNGLRKYIITVQYPSVLPLEERRIPMAFFARGFDANWNDATEYIRAAYISGNKLFYTWDDQFSRLYRPGKSIDADPIELASTTWVSFPYIRKEKITLFAGGGPDPNPVPPIPGEQRGDVPFFGIRVDCAYDNSRNVSLFGPIPDVTLPDPLWFELRLYLRPWVGGGVGYIPKVTSPLLDAIDVTISYPSLDGSIKDVNLKQWATGAIEDAVYHMQTGEHEHGFSAILRPWLVGDYEISTIRYEAGTDEMVIDYVGRAAGRQILDLDIEIGPIGEGPHTPDAPRLFDTPDELPAGREGLPDRQPRHATSPGNLSKIDHIVVLMQENRSFDQVLGYLSRDRGHSEVEGLLPDPNDRDKVIFDNREYASRRTHTSAWPSFEIPNPCHDHKCVERQISDGMKGAVADFAKRLRSHGWETPENIQRIMDYLTDEELPTFGGLVGEFAICDHWFCGHLGPTLPNRFVTYTGDLNLDVDGLPEYENPDLARYTPSERRTFFDSLTERDVSWKLWEHGYSFLRLFRRYTFEADRIAGFEDASDGFIATALAGQLPAVSFIEPDYIELPDANDDHAPADMLHGQKLIAKIVSALVRSPQWEKTLFVITYDEHGGFYDHVIPPNTIPSPSATGSTVPIPNLPHGAGVGPRVPAFVVSPYIPRGGGGVNVSKTVYDHTTIIATIMRRFCSPMAPSFGARTDSASDLGGLLTLDTPRPASEFTDLLTTLDGVLARSTEQPAGVVPGPPLRKPQADPANPEDHEYLEDFHGFMGYASSISGLGRR